MIQTKSAIEGLKLQLKKNGITYKEVAIALDVGEETIKNWLTKTPENLKLSNFEAMCEFADTSAANIFKELEVKIEKFELDETDEHALTQNPALMLLVFLLVNGFSLDAINTVYNFDPQELEGNLNTLENLEIISLDRTSDRVRVKASNNFGWMKNGPVEKVMRDIIAEFLSSNPDNELGYEIFIPGMASKNALEKINSKLEEAQISIYGILDQDVDGQHAQEREGFSVYLTSKRWVYSQFEPFRKDSNT